MLRPKISEPKQQRWTQHLSQSWSVVVPPNSYTFNRYKLCLPPEPKFPTMHFIYMYVRMDMTRYLK